MGEEFGSDEEMFSHSQCFAPFRHFSTMNQLSGTDFFSSLSCSELAARKKGAESEEILIHISDMNVALLKI